MRQAKNLLLSHGENRRFWKTAGTCMDWNHGAYYQYRFTALVLQTAYQMMTASATPLSTMDTVLL